MAKVWFITGSARGLGLAITDAALNAGGSVIATARKPEQLAHLVEEHGSDRVFPVALDVSNNDKVIEAVKAGHEKFGGIDVVNNARYANPLDLNLLGVVYVTKAVLPMFRQQNSGHIFQVSSLGGRIGAPGLCAYQSAKWAVGELSTALAQEVAPFGVKVTVLEPSGIKTDWAGSAMHAPEVSEAYKPTVGAFVEMLRNISGNEVSIPRTVAEIILKMLEEKEPPLRLLVGPDAVEYAGQAAEVLAASDRQWREVSISSASDSR